MAIYKIDKKRDGLQCYRIRVSYQDINGKFKQVERVCYGHTEAQMT